MENSKFKIALRRDMYYVIIQKKDEFEKVKQHWFSLGLPKGESDFVVQQKAKERLKQFEKENSAKSANFASKLANKRVQSKLSFSKFAENWLKQKRKNIELNTYDDYEYELKRIKDYFLDKNLKIKDIRPSHVDGFFGYLFSMGISNNTILHYHVLLNQIFRYALKNDIIQSNIMEKVDRPKKTKFEHQYYSPKQVQDLITLLESENSFLKVPIILTAMYGLRRSEIIGLLWNSIDFDNKKIYINHKVVETNKNGRQIIYHSNKLKNASSNRVLPLIENAEKILLNAKETIRQNKIKHNRRYHGKYAEYVCVDERGNLISPHRLTVGFSKFLNDHNMPKIRLHDLRHSCASMLVANGISMKAVQEWLGHSNYSTTANTYSHLDFSAKEQSGNKIKEIIYNDNNNSTIYEKKLEKQIADLIDKIDNLQAKIDKLTASCSI